MSTHLEQPVIRQGASLLQSKAVVVMMHGRSQTTDDILSLVDRIDLPDVHYMAPQAAGNSWYPKGFMEKLSENEPHVSDALKSYHARITSLLEEGVPLNKIVLAGFSQGACLTAEYALRHPGRYGGLLLFTGGALGPEGTRWKPNGSFNETPVFLGSSDVDSWVPEKRVHETAAAFEQAGAHVTKKIYKGMDHLVNDEEIAAAREMIQKVQASGLAVSP
ncbi:alpha/beta hydrolase [Alteribacillus sp. YIM 98480]|uniref:alpha/beta hydrolase n=1 Tax=Alteribacillus sp. YIM 98480 TaxID=2606599 RepID=UPI00131B5220|nr:dienelactone hydrolase family protein [Alteribacillus sp. YIM 98480]